MRGYFFLGVATSEGLLYDDDWREVKDSCTHIYICMCVCVCMYIYMCVCVCVCVTR